MKDAKVKGTQKVGGAGKKNGGIEREREPVIISFTTFFRPLVARLR